MLGSPSLRFLMEHSESHHPFRPAIKYPALAIQSWVDLPQADVSVNDDLSRRDLSESGSFSSGSEYGDIEWI